MVKYYPTVADNIKQYYDGNARHGLEGKIRMGGLLLVLTALVTFNFLPRIDISDT